MPYEQLSEFLTELEDAGELVRVAAPVDPSLELGAIVERVCRTPRGGPAILFEQVRGSALPVVANLLGSSGRLCRALGLASLEDLSARVTGAMRPEIPEGWIESLRLVPRFVELSKLPPKIVKTGGCQQVVRFGRDIDLRDLPISRSWPQEAAPSITAGAFVSVDPTTGVRTLDLIPLEVRNRQVLAIHWSRSDAAFRHFEAYRREGRPMPAAVVLGGHPATLVAGATPLPPTTDAYLFAGFLRNRGIDLVKCRTNDLPVPAEADLILEGVIDPNTEPETAGPIAVSTGFCSIPAACESLALTAVTHRSNPVFPALIPHGPPSEFDWIQKAVERMLQPIVRLFVPEVVEIHRPVSGASRNLLFVSIRKEYPQQARKVMNALWGLGPLATTKMIVVVDADVVPRQEESVWFHALANIHPGRDIVYCEGPTHAADHASPLAGIGHKIGLDGTRKFPEEGHRRPWPESLSLRSETVQLLTSRWSEYGLPTTSGESAGR